MNIGQKQVKVYYNGSTKRFHVPDTFESFKKYCEIAFNFNEIEHASLMMSYIDDDNDKVIISNDFEYEQAKLLMINKNLPHLKVTLEPKNMSFFLEKNASVIDINEEKGDKCIEDPLRSGMTFGKDLLSDLQEEFTKKQKMEEEKRLQEEMRQKEEEEKRLQEEIRIKKEEEEKRLQEEIRIKKEEEEKRLQEEIRIKKEEEEKRLQEEKKNREQLIANLRQNRVKRIVKKIFENLRKLLQRKKLAQQMKITKENIEKAFKGNILTASNEDQNKRIEKVKILMLKVINILQLHKLKRTFTFLSQRCKEGGLLQQLEIREAYSPEVAITIKNEDPRVNPSEEEDIMRRNKKVVEVVRQKTNEQVIKNYSLLEEKIDKQLQPFPEQIQNSSGLFEEDSKLTELQREMQTYLNGTMYSYIEEEFDKMKKKALENAIEKNNMLLSQCFNQLRKYEDERKQVFESEMTRISKISLNSTIRKSTVVHSGMQCENCKTKPIIGDLYKCSVCSYYILCESCEEENFSTRKHEHAFIRIRDPKMKIEPMISQELPYPDNSQLGSSSIFISSDNYSSVCLTEDPTVYVTKDNSLKDKEIIKALILKNDGKTVWPKPSFLECVKEKSTVICKTIPIGQRVKPGDECTLALKFTNLDHFEQGNYFSTFKLYHGSSKQYFGREFLIVIKINDPLKKQLPSSPSSESLSLADYEILSPNEKSRIDKLVVILKDMFHLNNNSIYSDNELKLALIRNQLNPEKALYSLLK